MSAAVAESGLPLQAAIAEGGRPSQAAVARSGRRPKRRPSQNVDKYPRTTCECGNHVHVCAENSYSTVGVNEQKDMVNSGVRGTKGMDLDRGVFQVS